MRKATFFAVAALAALSLTVGAQAAGAGQAYKVANGTSPATCAKDANFSSIQAAVDAAPAGATVNVCPGTYQEYVNVPAGKNNLAIKGLGGDPTSSNGPSAVILYPATPNVDPAAFDPNALVTITGSTGVSMDSMTVSGPFYDTGCEVAQTIHYGVFVIGGASAQLKHDYVTKIRPADQSLFGCQDGVGIRAGSNYLGQVGGLTLQNSLVDQYEKGGVVVDGPGSTGQIQNNTINGIGLTNQTAQNGIQISRHATGSAQGNTVTGNEYTDGTVATSAGILLYADGGGVSIQKNMLLNNDVALDIESSGNETIQDNVASTSSANIYATGIYLYSETSDLIKGNKVSGGAEGLQNYSVTSSTIMSNKVMNAGDIGIYNDSGSTGNTYKSNDASGSNTFDCQDDSHDGGTAGTANLWLNDRGATSNPPGICKK